MASDAPVQIAAVPDSYIVIFKKGLSAETCEQHCNQIHDKCTGAHVSSEDANRYGGIKHRYAFRGWRGYACSVDEQTKQEIEAADEVELVEPDYKVYTKAVVTQSNAPSWGLARISHKDKLTAATNDVYQYDDSAGQGVICYVIDTGILADHEDFGGRATFGYNSVDGSSDTDMNGHGTHVSGTIGGTKYGVAKKATIIGVKVLGDDGSGSNSTVIAGLQWAAEDAAGRGVIEKSVANMSLGGGRSVALNNAVAAIVDQGMTVCVAAGNETEDAKNSSPASERSCITVGSIAINDQISSFSNYGPAVDVFGPGTNITSTWIDETGAGSLTATNTISGTSMATPHITGLAAYLIAAEGLSGSPQVTARVMGLAIQGGITGLRGNTKNYMAYNGIEEQS